MRRIDSRPSRSHSIRRGFTLAELVVTVALIAIVIVSISQIFTIASDAAAKTEANSELLASSRRINETFEREIGILAPDCLLAIICPRPVVETRELAGGPMIPLRHDRIVFVTHGNPNQYQSFTDPTRATVAEPDLGPATSAEAIVYFGPGTPLTKNPGGIVQPIPITAMPAQLTANEWMFLHRCILLLPELHPDTNPAWNPPTIRDVLSVGGPLNNTTGNLIARYQRGEIDAIVSEAAGANRLRASALTLSQIIMSKNLTTDLLGNNPSISPLWSPSWSPRTLTLDPAFASRNDYYKRGGATFLPALADFRIEWTDGEVDALGPDLEPNTGDEGGTRWFGLRPDPRIAVTDNDLDVITTGGAYQNVPVRRHGVIGTGQELNRIYQDKVEWPNDIDDTTNEFYPSDPNAEYRAIWRADTWQYRPKALRFTYRLYDSSNRIKQSTEVDFDRDGDPDPDGTLVRKRQMVRLGREFSVVVPVP